MAPSRRPTAAQVRDRRARMIAVVLGGLLLVVGYLQGPTFLKLFSGSGNGSVSAALSLGTTSTPGVTAVAAVTPASVMAGGQLPRFSLFKPQSDPLHSQMPTGPGVTGAATTTTAGAGGSTAGATTTAKSATPTTTAATTPAKSTPATTTPAPSSTTPVPFVVQSGVLTAVLKVDGHKELIGVGGMFPVQAPMFKLVAFKGKRARIAVVGGSFTSGQEYLVMEPGHSVVFMDESDGTRYQVSFMKTTHEDPSKLTSPSQTAPGTSSPAKTTGTKSTSG